MKKESLEHLSSLMDGELTREAGLFITRRLSTDQEMCDTWERYHLIRDCIRQPGSKQFVTGLTARMDATLQGRDSDALPQSKFNRWLKPVSGFAIAASVAMAAIVVSVPQTPVPENTAITEVETTSPAFVSPNAAQLTPVSQAASFSGNRAGASRLNAYLLRHNQMARTAGRQGFVSFVPIVATPVETEKGKPDNDSSDDSGKSNAETTANQ